MKLNSDFLLQLNLDWIISHLLVLYSQLFPELMRFLNNMQNVFFRIVIISMKFQDIFYVYNVLMF